MKQKILTYLFVFSILLIIFQYVNAKRVFTDMNNKLEGYKTQYTRYKDSVAVLQDKYLDASHFNFNNNEDALSYFENKGLNVNGLENYIKDELYKTNETRGEHPIVPYASSEGRRMLINTVKLLNHKWIIADFSDGEFWGELFIKYYIDDDKNVSFELVESFLYPLN